MKSFQARSLARPIGLMALVVTLIWLPAPSTEAGPVTTYTVNSTADPGASGCNASECTLREAIAAVADGDVIEFDIDVPGTGCVFATGVCTISPTSALPPLNDDGVTINAYTQTGASPNTFGSGLNTEIRIVLDGSAAGAVSGLSITGNGNTVRGLNIRDFAVAGVHVSGDNNVIAGNFIGTDDTGMAPGPNGAGVQFPDGGIVVTGSGNRIGGSTLNDRNLVSGNGTRGIVVTGGGDTTTIQGNFVGIDAGGNAALGNGSDGVLIQNSPGNLIGGTNSNTRNIISANGFGAGLGSGLALANPASTGNVVHGNYIGTNQAGTTDLGNRIDGIVTNHAPANTIGGPGAGEGNLISGNNRMGLSLFFTNSHDNVVQGNRIGTNAAGTGAIGNSIAGVYAEPNANNNLIGGTNPGEGNLVAFNNGAGFQLDGGITAASAGNRILGNSIHSNAGLGIDLSGDGLTENDNGDGDAGPNGLQNFPELDSAALGSLTLDGTLNSVANISYRIEVFSNSECDDSGHGEGETFLGAFTLAVGGSGVAEFSEALPVTPPQGAAITATATNLTTNDTSEFSNCVPAGGSETPTPSPTPIPSATPTSIPTPVGQTPTPTPTPTPGPGGLTQGDNDCDGDSDAVDALVSLQSTAALPYNQQDGCIPLGSAVPAGAAPQLFGDIDCDGDVDAVDALQILRHVAGLGANQPQGCPAIGAAL